MAEKRDSKLKIPPGLLRAREIANRIASPLGKPLAAKKEETTCKLYLYSPIGKDMFGEGTSPEEVAKELDANKDATSLEVYLNSPGGYVYDGIAIYNTIRRFEGPKTVYVDGIAASIASVVALAGDKVITNEGATWMIHEPFGGIMVYGTADDIVEEARKEAAALRKCRENILDIYATATGQSVSTLSAWMNGETWMTADEALERGFTDEISRSEPPEEETEPPKKRAALLSPTLEADYARARMRALSGASPGLHPGQPGQTRSQQEQTK